MWGFFFWFQSPTSQLNNICAHRKDHSSSDKLNPMFQEQSVKDRPQISQPTFMESTASQACTPLIVTVTPSRPAPQVRLTQEEAKFNSSILGWQFMDEHAEEIRIVSQYKVLK